GVHGPSRRRRQLARRDEAGRGERLQALGEERRRDADQLRAQVREPAVAEHELAQHEEAPAVAEQVERARDRTVLRVRRLPPAPRLRSRRRRRTAPTAGRGSHAGSRLAHAAPANAPASAIARTRRDAASAASASAPTTASSRTATFLWYGVAAIGSQSSCAVMRFRRGPSTILPPFPSGYDWP